MDEKNVNADACESESVAPDESSGGKHRKRQRRGLSYYFTGGIIMSLLEKLTSAVYNAFSNGIFGMLFTSYAKEQAALDSSYTKGYFLGSGLLHKHSRNARKALSEGFENSFFVDFFNKINRALLGTSVKYYGNAVLSFGLYTIFIYFLRTFFTGLGKADNDAFFTGVILVIVSIPLLMSKSCLAAALGSSACGRLVLCEFFGFRDESFEVPVKKSKTKANISIIIGVLAGFATLIVKPIDIIIVFALFVTVALIISSPESGIIISLFLLPFFSLAPNPTLMVSAIVGLCIIGFLVKLIRGKRVLQLEMIDFAVIFFMFVIFFSGAISVGGQASFKEALVSCMLMLAYFLITNMMRTEKWIRRCVMSLVNSATVVAIIGILQYFLGNITTQWLDTSYFSGIKGRVVSVFDNSNVLAFYLVMIFPFALDLVSRLHKRKKLFGIFSASMIVLCVVLTWSRGAWLGLIASGLVYFLIRSRKTLKLLFGIVFALPIFPVILPANVIQRFMSIGDMSDSSTYYRVCTWKASLEAFFDNAFGGVGYGVSAFREIYPIYAYAGIEFAEHSHNLFLQIGLSTGIAGLVAFLAVIVLFAQKSFGAFKDKDRLEMNGMALASFAAFVAAMTMGMFDYIWYNFRVFFLFWAIIGIGCAAIRVGDQQAKRTKTEFVYDDSSASIDI